MPPAGRFLEKSSAKTFNILGPFPVKDNTRTACLQAAVCNKLVLIKFDCTLHMVS